jgi:hypothetical protein
LTIFELFRLCMLHSRTARDHYLLTFVLYVLKYKQSMALLLRIRKAGKTTGHVLHWSLVRMHMRM